MTHELAERRVKGLQKEFLFQIEDHPALLHIEPALFNELRKKIFRGTFEAYRLGVVGLPQQSPQPIWMYFFGWLDNQREIRLLDAAARMELVDTYFRTALEAYRTGVLVSADRSTDDAVFE